jgi:uncharacterized membrane protein YdjX (TVP38/TMEM64 family)
VVQVDKKNKKILFFASVAAAVLVAVGIYLAIRFEYLQQAVSFVDQSMSSSFFIALMVVLPVVGFPISVFLIVGGIKFGILWAILLWLAVLPIHATIGYYVARWARGPLERVLSDKMGYHIPEIPENNTAMFSFLFLAIPGIPYAGKNYLLALAGVPFRYCVLMNCIVQCALGMPFIVLGKSAAEMDMTLFYIALGIFTAGYFLLRWLKKRYGNKVVES